MVESPAEVRLGTEQCQCAVVDLEFAHAARPPSFGSKEVGAIRACGLGLYGIKVQPWLRASRRTSNIRSGRAAVGWICRVAVVCIWVASVVVSERILTFKVKVSSTFEVFLLRAQLVPPGCA